MQIAKVYCKLSLHDNQSRKSPLRKPLEFKEATVAFSLTFYKLDHNSKYDLINCIGILPYDDMHLPLAGSLLPIPATIFIPGWATKPRRRIKGQDIYVLEGWRGLSYAEGVTLCLSSQERGILYGEKGEGEEKGGVKVKGAVLDLGGLAHDAHCQRKGSRTLLLSLSKGTLDEVRATWGLVLKAWIPLFGSIYGIWYHPKRPGRYAVTKRLRGLEDAKV
jgi:hypothetical protein